MTSSWSRQRVSQACKICQARKIKCGGELPHCATCIRLNRVCSYGVSKRNTRTNIHSTVPALSPQTTAVPEQANAEEPFPTRPQQPQDRENPLSVSAAESVRLFEKYFTCIHPIWPLLYKPIYDPLGYGGLADHLPTPVVFAIYAIVSCLQDEWLSGSGGRPASQSLPPSPNQFFEAALAELQRGSRHDRDLNMIHALRPSVSHCQALTILALQQHGVAEFTRASLLCSLAATMAIDLRLHRCCGPEGSVERQVGSRLWWNIYVLEKMMSFEMGRPIAWRFEEADAPFPSIHESDEFELFRWPARASSASNQSLVPMPKMQTMTAFHTTIELCRLMERISCEIYSVGARELIKQVPASGDTTRIRLWREIQAWQQARQSSSLKVNIGRDEVTLPVMVTNHVQIYSVTIILHRPFISAWLQHASVTGQPPFDTPSPSDICYQAAEDICVVLESYSQYIPQLPCDLIFPIFTAATMLVHQLRHSKTEVQGREQRLELCLSWLSVFAKNWRNAREREKMLCELYESPGTPLAYDSTPLRESQSPLLNRDQLQHASLADGARHTRHPGYVGNDLGGLAEAFPDLNTEFWMFLDEQLDWSG